MPISTYLSTIESKKQTKRTRTETEVWIYREFFDGCPMGCGGKGDEVRRLRITNRDLADMAQWIEHQPGNQRVANSIPWAHA